ncbi:hypothetical protein, partial [Cohnella laeviribosi]|uniref:hypothetical protein n=1 Tax=Cohnella laeviribosi TaxID=380174 RepID=UPI003D1D0344
MLQRQLQSPTSRVPAIEVQKRQLNRMFGPAEGKAGVVVATTATAKLDFAQTFVLIAIAAQHFAQT